MTETTVIELLNNSKSYIDVFPNPYEWEPIYNEYIKLIHPDVCKLNGSSDATAKLLQYRDELTKGISHVDDAGTITYFPNKGIIKSANYAVLRHSVNMYQRVQKLKPYDVLNYIPKTYSYVNEDIIFTFPERAIPLSKVGILPQEHINWITSRMLEFIVRLHYMQITHNGINPDSVYIVPKTHGIIVTSFYHSVEMDSRLYSLSGRYSHFYPEKVFKEKIASPDIDLELVKRTVAYLLGDVSGNGSKFIKTHNKSFIKFLLEYDNYALGCLAKFRNILSKEFNSQFHPLNI